MLNTRLDPIMYFRYVDDQGNAALALPPGARLVGDKLEIVQEMIEADRQVPSDLRSGRIYQQVANTILPMIQLELDCPSLHPNNKIPVLDLELWLDKKSD